MTRETILHYELRDDVDDLPYARTYRTMLEAQKAAQAKADKQGHEILIYEVSDRGEFYRGSVW